MAPNAIAMIEASGPNEPPVMISGPDSVAVRIDSSVCRTNVAMHNGRGSNLSHTEYKIAPRRI